MNKDELKKEILKLLKVSTIPQHDKNMVEILLPAMTDEVLHNAYNTLLAEQNKMTKLNDKQQRIELKYKVMVDKISKMKENKKA